MPHSHPLLPDHFKNRCRAADFVSRDEERFAVRAVVRLDENQAFGREIAGVGGDLGRNVRPLGVTQKFRLFTQFENRA